MWVESWPCPAGCYRSDGGKRDRLVSVGGTGPIGGIVRSGGPGFRLATAPGVGRDLQPRMEGEFLQDVVNVSLYRIGGEVQAQGNLLVAQPVRDQVEDSPLSFRHADRLDHVWVVAADRELCNVGKECG